MYIFGQPAIWDDVRSNCPYAMMPVDPTSRD